MKKKIYILSSLVFIIDFLVKLIIQNTLSLYQSIKVIPDFFYITFVINDGAAFSILEGKQPIFIILGILVIIFILRYLQKEKLNKFKVAYYSLLIGGIVGNLFDRIVYNGVVDYLDFNLFGYNFPVFNIADSCIFISVCLIFLEMGKEAYENRRRG